MKTITGIEIPSNVKGIVYLCDYNYKTYELKVVGGMFFKTPFEALNAYANTPNPASQVAYETKDSTFEEQLQLLHNGMNDLEWRKELSDFL